MKKKLIFRNFFIIFCFFTLTTIMAVSVWTSSTWVMSAQATLVSWGVVGMALIAILSLDKVFVQALRFYLRREKLRWDNNQRYSQMRRANPNWAWRAKGELKFPKKARR